MWFVPTSWLVHRYDVALHPITMTLYICTRKNKTCLFPFVTFRPTNFGYDVFGTKRFVKHGSFSPTFLAKFANSNIHRRRLRLRLKTDRNRQYYWFLHALPHVRPWLSCANSRRLDVHPCFGRQTSGVCVRKSSDKNDRASIRGTPTTVTRDRLPKAHGED